MTAIHLPSEGAKEQSLVSSILAKIQSTNERLEVTDFEQLQLLASKDRKAEVSSSLSGSIRLV